MPNTSWVTKSLDYINRNDNDKKLLFSFWKKFYNYLLENQNLPVFVKDKSSNSEQYKSEVLKMLHNHKESAKNKNIPLSSSDLYNLQMSIEDMTMSFDEESLFKTVPNIIKILIKSNDLSAKDYLKGRLDNKDDQLLLSEFGQYTIEALIVYVLCMVFNIIESNSMIRVASLVERLESSVRQQASLLKYRRCNKSKQPFSMETEKKVKKRSKLEIQYPIGSSLVEFMVERQLITLINDVDGTVRVHKKKGDYYLPRYCYAFCNFDLSLLPIKLNLPMVYPPLDWTSCCEPGSNPMFLSDLSGGYLCSPIGTIYDRYRLLSSGDLNHLYIYIGKDYQNLCNVINKLQRQPFQINSDFLKYLKENEDSFVENGLLMPRFLANMNFKEIFLILREFHMKDELINKLCSFSELLQTVSKNIQRARYEHFIINLARAYEGYNFYLPAFLDFRGRIYRSGILHFHERDLARSLIVFSDMEDKASEKIRTFLEATAFHYKSFASVEESIHFFDDNMGQICNESIVFARDAKHPFQFLSNMIRLNNVTNKNSYPTSIPITQDGSASAYQIMSYFLLDESLAMRTNLIPSPDGQIQDVYIFILEELKEFMIKEMDNKNLSKVVINALTRKIVKGIFMPIIYGKTLMSTACDLKEHLSHFITQKECFIVASVCFKFWRTKYHHLECLIRLIRHIGWIASARDTAVLYRIPFFTTIQDSMKMMPINIWVYDRLHKKRRRVTLRVSSDKRDRKKTEISTFVNFIHQWDAHIAMRVVEKMLTNDAPIYTVHDNFITTASYSNSLPKIYSSVFCEFGPPLSILNDFIYINIIHPIDVMESKSKVLCKKFACKVIPKEILSSYLEANVPKNISKKMKTTWDNRISGILTSYEVYTSLLCGNSPNPSFEAHEKRWNEFMLMLKSGEKMTSYCVHY